MAADQASKIIQNQLEQVITNENNFSVHVQVLTKRNIFLKI